MHRKIVSSVELVLFLGLLAGLAGLAVVYPSTLWAGDDYSLQYLAAACNAGARLHDLVMYKTTTMAYHPAVPFYIFSWLAAFAALGTGAIGSDLSFFDRLIDNAPALFVSLKASAIIVTALLVLVYRMALIRLVPAAVAALAIALYFVTTPQSIFRSVYPLTETFALAVNALFLLALVRFARNPLGLWPSVLSAMAVAFAYLLKVSFLYVYGGLLIAFLYVVLFGGHPWRPLVRLFLLSHAIGLILIVIVGFCFIGREYFVALLRLHWAIVIHGAGSEANSSISDVLQSIWASWRSGATAIPIVLVVAPALLLAVTIATRRKRISVFVGAIAVGAATASLASVAAVLTRYGETYAIGIAATVPLLFAGVWLFASDRRTRRMVASAGLCVAMFSAWRSVSPIEMLFLDKSAVSAKAEADMQSIEQRVGPHEQGLYLYRVSMPGYGKGYVALHCDVPAITNALLDADRAEQSSMARSVKDPDYVVADTGYNFTEAAIKSGKNLDPLDSVPTTYREGDEIIRLNDAWLLIRKKAHPAPSKGSPCPKRLDATPEVEQEQ